LRIEEEIQQTSFPSEFHKMNINILFTAAWINQRTTQLLKPYKISWQQFNILRILRGQYPKPATVKTLTTRMIDKMSNASRLVEKLRQKGYVKRTECSEDRRRVDIVITDLGLEMVDQASQALEAMMNELFEGIPEAEAVQVNQVLDQMRE
jgi:DNA-binding MarR family transcriptional regulator